MLILLLYAAGLRISEALSLQLTDVDLSAGILMIGESKFYKTRLVPTSPALTATVGSMWPNVQETTLLSWVERCS